MKSQFLSIMRLTQDGGHTLPDLAPDHEMENISISNISSSLYST